MSGLVSAITKVFTSIGGGLATGAATLGSAVRGVGASLFTGMAATGSSLGSGLSNLFSGGTSILGNMFSGVSDVLGLSPATAALGATGVEGAANAASALGAAGVTGLGATVGPGMAGAQTLLSSTNAATGFIPAGMSAGTTAATKGLGESLLNSNLLAGVLQGVGEKSAMDDQIEALKARDEAAYAFQRQNQQRITSSYDVPNSALPGMSPAANQNQPAAQQVAAPKKSRWVYDPNQKQIVKQAVA